MALFLSETGFDAAMLDFNVPYRTAHTVTPGVSQSIPFSLPDLPIGSASYPLPSHDLGFSGSVKLTGLDHSLGFGGEGLSYDAQGALTGGALTFIGLVTAGSLNYGVAGVSLNAVDFNAAAQTASTADDVALFDAQFAGNDLITLSTFGDVFNAGLGRDLILDLGGSDTLNGGGGDDLILSGKGNDRVDGGLGNDLVLAGVGDDRVKGQRRGGYLVGRCGQRHADRRGWRGCVPVQGGRRGGGDQRL